jgi:hypothetical protein
MMRGMRTNSLRRLEKTMAGRNGTLVTKKTKTSSETQGKTHDNHDNNYNDNE